MSTTSQVKPAYDRFEAFLSADMITRLIMGEKVDTYILIQGKAKLSVTMTLGSSKQGE